MSRHVTRTVVSIMAAATTLTATACKARKGTNAGSNLRGATYIYTIEGSQIRSAIGPDGRVSFYIEANGQQEIVTSMDDSPEAQPFLARQNAAGHWVIEWYGVPIGEKRGDDTEICGERFGYQDICDAIFIQRPADQPAANNVLSIGFLEKGRMMFPAGGETVSKSGKSNPRAKFDDDSARGITVDISQHAMPQVHQRNTGTCLYNSTTGIIEWYRNLNGKTAERLSAPDVLARLASLDRAAESQTINDVNKHLDGVAPDQYLPTQTVYDQNPNDFMSAYNYSRQMAPTVASKRVRVPGIKGTVLFMHQEPAAGVRNQNFASAADMAKVRDWLVNKRRPVHFFHLYANTTIWHAVIALGWDDARGLVLIKDSLGGSNYLGTWRTVAEMQRGGYGAVGTMEATASTDDLARIPDPATNNPLNNPGTGTPGPDSPSPQAMNFKAALVAIDGYDYLFVYSKNRASRVEILDGAGNWLPLDIAYIPQPGWQTIGAIWVNRDWRARVTSFNARAVINGRYESVTLPLRDKR